MNKLFRCYRIALIILLVGAFFMPSAAAAENMSTAANRIIVDVYGKIAEGRRAYS